MQEQAFDEYMVSRRLADATRSQRTYALKRIERAEGDLDTEFARDGLQSMLDRYSYSAADFAAGAANPTNLEIDPDKLLAHLRWYRSHLSDYVKFKGGFSAEPDSAVETVADAFEGALLEEAVGKTFALEKDLQAALRANLSQLEDGMTVADGGNERRVDAGYIDILARDSLGVLTVIELKADIAKPDAVTQILSYMACISESSGEAVRGILVAADHHPRVKFAVRAVSNLSLRSYRFRFEFD